MLFFVFLACFRLIVCSIFVAIMFFQATKSKRQNKTYVSYLVRESFRTSQGPRSRTVCNISALPPEVRDLVDDWKEKLPSPTGLSRVGYDAPVDLLKVLRKVRCLFQVLDLHAPA